VSRVHQRGDRFWPHTCEPSRKPVANFGRRCPLAPQASACWQVRSLARDVLSSAAASKGQTMAEARRLSPSIDLADFFSAVEARTDLWRQLGAIGREWESAIPSAQSDELLHAQAGRLLAELSPAVRR
jgi:hypothetical protein